MFNQFYVSGLYALAGAWLFAAVHHAVLSRQRPLERPQALLALFCLLMAGYIALKAAGQPAFQYEEVVAGARRVEIITGAMAFALVPWLIVDFLGTRDRWVPAGLSLYFLIIALAVAGMAGAGPPETGSDLPPILEADRIHAALLLGLGAAQIHGALSCLREYRSGAVQCSYAFGAALGAFALGTACELMRVLELADASLAFELGLLPTLALMSGAVGNDRRVDRARMQALLNHVPAMVTLKDRDGRYLLANKAFMDAHRIGPTELRGHTDLDLLPRERAIRERGIDAEALSAGKELETEEQVQALDGSRYVRAVRFAVLDSPGHIWGLGCVTSDITATRKAELQALELRTILSHLDRVTRLDAISASIAHEIMQPLAAVLSNGQAGLRLLDRPSPPLQEIGEVLADIVSDTKRASQVVRSLRDMTRRIESSHEQFDLSTSVREILDMLSAEMKLKGILCRSHLVSECIVTASKPQVQQVLLNLLMNAMHAVDGRPERERRICVRAGPSDSGTLQVSVRDSGSGIASSELSRLFEPFYTTKPEGMGIGLTVCRAIVEGHQGQIWAERNSPAPGATFKFALPARESAGASGMHAAREGGSVL